MSFSSADSLLDLLSSIWGLWSRVQLGMFIIEADHNTDAVVISPLKDVLVELMRRHGVSDAQG